MAVQIHFLALFAAASVLLLFAHAARALRWALLFPSGYTKRGFNLLMGLSLGYVLNAIIPFRLGEILRAYFVSARENIPFPLVAATVASERVADVIAVAAISIAFSFSIGALNERMWPLLIVMLGVVACIISAAFLIRASSRVRRATWFIASIFNDRLRFAVIDFVWSLAEIIASGSLLRLRFLAMTVAMWALYIASYVMFGYAVREPLGDVLYSLLGSPLHPLAERVTDGKSVVEEIPILLFAVLPILGVIGYGFAIQWSAILRALTAGGWYGRTVASSRNRFKVENEYWFFLAALFSGDDHVVTGFGLRAIEDGVVHKFFQGGSDAVTALVEVDGRLLIRKFAVGEAAEKLKVQANWLAAHRDREIPLVEVVGERQGTQFFRYDMPLIVPANDFYDVIHTSQVARSEDILKDIISRLSHFHEKTANGFADDAAIEAYLKVKVQNNAKLILDFARTALPQARFQINGVDYDLEEWHCFADHRWLSSQIRDRRSAIIHGDLTIENIVIAPSQPAGWYLIDPNPENLFESPLIDWAKLSQSLHLGYEGLNRGAPCTLSDASFSLPFTRSQTYSHLHSALEKWIVEKFGIDALREVCFHELVNYLRLTPYKIRHDPAKGLTFFVGTSILLRRYLDRWERGLEGITWPGEQWAGERPV